MINKLFKDINSNSFYTNISINVFHNKEKSILNFDGLINSGRSDLNISAKSSLHPEANMLIVKLLPNNMNDVKPFNIQFIGTWQEFINNIKSQLLELNRRKELIAANVNYILNDQDTRVINFIKAPYDNYSEFQQIITQSDIDYAKIENMMNKIRQENNREQMKLFGNYLYEIMISPK